MKLTKTREWLANQHREGEFPPGVWACAGRLDGEAGAYLGWCQKIRAFVPQRNIKPYILQLESLGETDLAELVKGIEGDVEAVRTGRQQIAVDLDGSWVKKRYDVQ